MTLPTIVLLAAASVGTIKSLPVADYGDALDNAPFDNVADAIEPTFTLIGNINDVQRRAIVEFDLAGLFPGTVLSATLTGRIQANNPAGGVTTRTERIVVFAGDGVLGLNDYNVTGTVLGTVSHTAGGSSAFSYDVKSLLQELGDSGATHLAVRVDPVNAPQGWDALEVSFGGTKVTADVVPIPEPSSMLMAGFGFAGLLAFGWRKHP